MVEKRSYKKALEQAYLSLLGMMPMIVAVVGLVGLVEAFVSPRAMAKLFSGDPVTDTLLGTFAGAVAVGNAMVSYILGGELLDEGISIYAVTAFVLSWVTLGVVQLPAEVEVFGLRFTLYRNLLALLFTLLVALATVQTVRWLG
ncbi:permease [Hydrogenimonas sp.]